MGNYPYSIYIQDCYYKPTKRHGNADCFSRLPQVTDIEFEKNHTLEPVINLIQETQLAELSADRVKEETEKDEVLPNALLKTHLG